MEYTFPGEYGEETDVNTCGKMLPFTAFINNELHLACEKHRQYRQVGQKAEIWKPSIKEYL